MGLAAEPPGPVLVQTQNRNAEAATEKSEEQRSIIRLLRITSCDLEAGFAVSKLGRKNQSKRSNPSEKRQTRTATHGYLTKLYGVTKPRSSCAREE